MGLWMEKEFVLAPDLVILSRSDLSGKITSYNEGFREVSGYSDVDLLGASHNILRHPDVPKAVFQDHWQTIEAGYTWSGVIKNRRKDGDYYWVFSHVTPIVEEGRTTGYLSVRYPATQQQIIDAQTQYRNINMGKHSVAKSSVSLLGQQDIGLGILLTMTPLALGIQALVTSSLVLGGLGILSAGVGVYVMRRLRKGRLPTQAQQDAIRSMANGNFRDPLQGSDPWSIVLNGMRARLAEFSAMRYDAKKVLQQRADALAESSRYKSEFLANMGHELRTPLNSINVLAGLLAQNGLGNLSQQQIEQLQVIHYAGRDLLALINDLLDFSKIEAGKMSVALEWVDMTRIAEEMLTIFSPLIHEKGLSASLVMDRPLPNLYTDAAKVRQIIKNFMANALKFTDTGGVTLELVRAENPRFAIELRVHDTGCGIPMDKQEEIFDSFCQADGTTSRKYGGTGLGLSICRQLAQKLGGGVFVKSAPNEGATFTLLLPLEVSVKQLQAESVEVVEIPVAASEVTESVSAHDAIDSNVRIFAQQEGLVATLSSDVLTPSPEKRATLLLIDDDALFVSTLRNVLRHLGISTLHATHPREGMMMAAQYQPDGILLSWRMLALGDIDLVLQSFQEHPNTRQIPLKVLTNDAFNHEHWVKDVASEVLLPFSETTNLTKLVADLINGRQLPVAMFLLVGDEVLRQTILTGLTRCMSEAEWVVYERATEALSDIPHEEEGIVVMDLSLKDMSAFAFLDQLQEKHPNWSVIVYVQADVELAVMQKLATYADVLALKVCNALPKLIDVIALWLRHPINSSKSCEQALPTVGKASSPDSISLAGREILIVDNDVRNLYALRALLEANSMKVVMAYSGREALDILQQDVFVQALITDIMMPDVNGYELISLVREQTQWEKLPIIALTAKVGTQERERCVSIGADDYLAKPVDEVMLLSLLRGLIAQQQPRTHSQTIVFDADHIF
jgi:PAS domain S-box-containing protein